MNIPWNSYKISIDNFQSTSIPPRWRWKLRYNRGENIRETWKNSYWRGCSAAWSVNHGWFALWYLQLSQNCRLPSVKISDFVTTMYRGIDTLIGYVLFRPRGPANQTSRSLSSIQTIYTILEPPCSTCPFPYPSSTVYRSGLRLGETKLYRIVQIVDRDSVLLSHVTRQVLLTKDGNFVRGDRLEKEILRWVWLVGFFRSNSIEGRINSRIL